MLPPNWKNLTARFLTAQTLSLFGSSLVQYAIIWHITLSTSSGKMLTLSTLCGFLPQILISLFAGVWVDRYSRKALLIVADCASALCALLLAIAFFSGQGSIWLLFIALALRSAGAGIQTPAVNAVIPQLVPEDKLMRVNGIQSTLSSLTMFLSPAASGAVLAAAPLAVVLLIDVFTAAAGVGITLFIPLKKLPAPAEGKRNGFGEIKSGFLYLKENPFVKRLLVYQLILLFLISPSAFLTPLMVSRSFGGEVWRLTFSEMSYSLGMVLGGLLITLWGGFKNKMATSMAAGAFYGALMVGMGCAPLFPLYLICNALVGITSPCYNAPITVSIQQKVPPAMLGRVFSFMQIATSCALPLGMALFGPLADAVPVQSILIVGGLLVLALSVTVWKKGYFSPAASASAAARG